MKRLWKPVALALVIAGSATAFVLWAGDNVDRHTRVMTGYGAALAIWAIFAGWIFLFSGGSLARRFLLLLIYVIAWPALAFAVIREWHNDGDLGPVITFRWEPRRQVDAPPTEAVPGEAPLRLSETAEDFLEYRGAGRAGVIVGPALNVDRPPRILWHYGCGGGYGGISVSGNALFTIEQRPKENKIDPDEEQVVCLHADTGRVIWNHRYPALFAETLGGDGPRTTPTVNGGQVFALGATGRLICLDAKSGQEVWHRDILEGNTNIQWGMSGSPLVDDRVVVVNPGAQVEAKQGAAVVAYDRKTGERLWSAGDTRAGYSSPMFARLCGREQVLVFDGEQMAGYDRDDGTRLWTIPWTNQYQINVAQPMLLPDDHVFISSAYNVGCGLYKIVQKDGRFSAHEVWRNRNMRCKFTSPVAHDGYLYGMDEGIMVCLDIATGSRQWKAGRYGNGQLLRQGDVLLVFSETGSFHLIRASPERHQPLTHVRVINDPKNWNCFAVARGKAWVRNHREMACLELAEPME